MESLLIKPVEKSGWDNRTFYLSDDMTIMLSRRQCQSIKLNK